MIVRDYATGAALDGTSSAALAEQSAAAPQGVVSAYRDAAGVWQHVPESREDFFREIRGETVVSVYVEEA